MTRLRTLIRSLISQKVTSVIAIAGFSVSIYMALILIALSKAMLTVSWHSLKAAIRNPVEALRYE